MSPRLPVVLLANRDEFFDRPTRALSWWRPDGAERDVLGGCDRRGGGTWLGMEAGGRLALLTNVRNGAVPTAGAPSRGLLVTRWLTGEEGFDAFWRGASCAGYDGFNLIAADLARDEWMWASNAPGTRPLRLARGIHGLSNAALDTPWPKTERLKARLRTALDERAAVADAAWIEHLFAALADPRTAADAELPRTGISLEWERLLSAAFIRTPDGSYGTRCSTVLTVERQDDGTRRVRFIERSFAAEGGESITRSEELLLS